MFLCFTVLLHTKVRKNPERGCAVQGMRARLARKARWRWPLSREVF